MGHASTSRSRNRAAGDNLVMLALLAVIGPGGCLSVGEPTGVDLLPSTGLSIPIDRDPSGLLGSASRAAIAADWNDLNASVDAAIEQAELAVIDSNPPDSTRRIFLLRTTGDEYGWLVVTPDPDAPPNPSSAGESMPMLLRCTIGRLGFPARERRFLDALTRRLLALKGVEHRPL